MPASLARSCTNAWREAEARAEGAFKTLSPFSRGGSVEVLGVFTCTKSFSAGDEDSQCAHKSNPVVPSERCWGALVVATGMWHAALWEQNPSKKKNTHQNSPSPLRSDLLDSKK